MTENLEEWSRTRAVCSTLEILDRIDSTNSFLARSPRSPDYSAVISLNQTSGRGRWGREWVNRAGEGLALSLLLPRQCFPNGQSDTFLPLIAGACVAVVLKEVVSEKVTMKWPNDILILGKKVGGILCELRGDGRVIVGIGLNLEFRRKRPSESAVALAEFLPLDHDVLDFLVSRIVSLLIEKLELPREEQKTLVAECLDTVNRRVLVSTPDGVEWSGVALAIQNTGALRVKRDDGVEIDILSSEVHHLYQ